MRYVRNPIVVLGCLLAIPFALVSCGGGGGGGGGLTVPASYTGLTTQAVIDGNNAVTLITGAYSGGVAARDIGDVVPLEINNDVQATQAGLLPIVERLADIVRRCLPTARSDIQPLALITETIPGDCGGQALVSINVNEVSGAFTGSVTFSLYCSFGTTMSGTVPVSGQVDLNLLTLTRLTLTFNNLEVSDATSDWTFIEGTANFVIAADLTSETDTLNLVIRSSLLQKNYWLNNYVIHITVGLPDAVTFTGRYYDPDDGYCDITTLATLQVGDTALPTGGILGFAGAGSQAKLTFNSDQSTLLEVDANNDGTYEITIANPL